MLLEGPDLNALKTVRKISKNNQSVQTNEFYRKNDL